MKTLEQRVQEQQAITRPADPASIDALQASLGFSLSSEYRDFLSRFGIIVHNAYETYGLGISDDYYLNVLISFKDLSKDPSYPISSVPLIEVGDGQYYLYDNETHRVLLWATPNGGVVRVLNEDLESFLLKQVFSA